MKALLFLKDRSIKLLDLVKRLLLPSQPYAVLLVLVHNSQAVDKSSVTMKVKTESHKHMGMKDLAPMLGMGKETAFRKAETAKLAMGKERVRLRQMYQGVDVIGGSATVEMTADGNMTGHMHGNLLFHMEDDVPDVGTCHRSDEDLRERALRFLKDVQVVLTAANNLTQFSATKKIFPDDGVARVVYEVQFFVLEPPGPIRPFFLFDACDPDLKAVLYVDTMQNSSAADAKSSSRSPRSADNRYYSARPAYRRHPSRRHYEESHVPSNCPNRYWNKMRAIFTRRRRSPSTVACPWTAPARGLGGNLKTGVHFYGETEPFCLPTTVIGNECFMTSKFATVLNGTARTVPHFPCDEGIGDPINGAYGVANDAYLYGYKACEMYTEWYGIDCLHIPFRIRVHVYPCYDNAAWTGRAVIVGDGCGFFYPLASVDVLGHELAHGFTQGHSGLLYSGQPGGINEAFSDMAGKAAEFYLRGTVSWQFGSEIVVQDRPLRYMDTPSQDGLAIDSANDVVPGLSVHRSSGVFNRAFWHLVNVQGLPIRQAFEVFMHANRMVWVETTDFQSGACGAMQAAYDIGYDVTKVRNAFSEVDIDLSACDFEAFGQTVALGDKGDVTVSAFRNRVFKLDLPLHVQYVFVEVFNRNHFYSDMIKVTITSDAMGVDDVACGSAPFKFRVTSDTSYLKLSSLREADSTFELLLREVDYDYSG